MDSKTSPLKKVTYTRAHDSDRSHNVVLGGDSRWLRDIELLLEDKWKNIFCPEDESAFQNMIQDRSPKVCLIELGAYSNQDVKLIEQNYSPSTSKFILGHHIQDQLAWRRMQRLMSAKGVTCIELSDDVHVASTELDELLSSIVAIQSSNSDTQIVQYAFEGYRLNYPDRDESLLKVFKLLASKYTFDPNEIITGMLLVETYSLWKQPKDTSSELHFAYLNLENSITDEKITKLIKLASDCLNAVRAGDLSESQYTELLAQSGLGRLSVRALTNTFQEVKQAASGKPTLRLLKVA